LSNPLEGEYHDRYQQIASLIADCFYELHFAPDQQIGVNWVSESFTRLTGYSLSDLVSRGNWTALFHSDELGRLGQHLATVCAGRSSVAEFRIVLADGSHRWLHDTLVPVWDTDHRQVVALFGAAQDISERKQAEWSLQHEHDHLAAMIDTAGAAIIAINTDYCIMLFNQGAEHIFGYAGHEVIGRPLDILLPEGLQSIHRQHVQAFASLAPNSRSMGLRRELLGRRRDGSEFPLEASIAHTVIGNKHRLTVVLYDVTAHKQTASALHDVNHRLMLSVAELEQRTRELATMTRMGENLQGSNSIGEAYAIIARFARQLFPAQSGAVSMQRPEQQMLEAVVAWGDQAAVQHAFAADSCWAIRRGRIHLVDAHSTEMPCAHTPLAEHDAMLCVPLIAQGEALGVLHIHFAASAAEHVIIPAADRQLAIAIAEQIALALSNLKLRETLRSQAVRDPLTGLFNRRYMEESLERELHRASRNRYPIGVIMIDVDYFKRFNDTHGHEAGDTMLRAVGEFLQSSIRAEDIACRYGGEEFTLIMPQASLEVTTDRAEHVRNTIKNLQVFYLNHPLGPVSISAGVTVIPRHGMSVQSALRQADRALYRAKNAGRDQVMIARIDDDDDDDDDNGDER
jgi:diguanylate cyclase (GGDEF)-like protein/PAS domain S-box-containing protein